MASSSLTMGTNIDLSSPVCFDRNIVSLGFNSAKIGDYSPRPASSGNQMILSDSEIQLLLLREDDDLDRDVNGFSVVERSDGLDLTTSPGYKDRLPGVKNEPTSSCSGLESFGLSEKLQEPSSVSSSECSSKPTVTHRSKGRPAKLTSTGNSGNGSGGSVCRGVIQCPICHKNFNNSSALAKHKLIHSDERKYSCSVCFKAFKRQDHLNGHMMTHSAKKPYECRFANCDKSYCDQRSLRRHIENHHQQYMDVTPPTSGQLSISSSSGAVESVFQFEGNFLSKCSSMGDPGCNGLLASPVPSIGTSPSPSQKATWPFGYNPLDEPKPVKCSVCDRRFKNLPALNGHMRLHGGFIKKDLTETEGQNDDLCTSKSENDDSRDLSSQASRCEWPTSTTVETTASRLSLCLKQEDSIGDSLYGDMEKSISSYPDFLRAGGGFQAREKDYKRGFFTDTQTLTSETLPLMEDLKLRDSVENPDSDISFRPNDLLNNPSIISEDCRSDGQRSLTDQQYSAYTEHKYGMTDTQPACFPTLTRELAPTEVSDVSVNQQNIPAFSGYRSLLGSSSGIHLGQNISTAGNSHLSGNPSKASGTLLHRSLMGNKIRKSVASPLTPSYTMQHNNSVLRSKGYSISSTPGTPHSPYPARAMYPMLNPPKCSNASVFEFPPKANVDSGVLSHPSTPIHSGFGLSRQLTPHTPLSPYTPQPNAPYTPRSSSASSRLSRFQFPPTSGLMDNGTCESPLVLHQKPSYHPYNHPSSLSSPHYMQLQKQSQVMNKKFEEDVIQMDKEIEQRLQQLMEADAKKSTQCSADPVFFNSDARGRQETQRDEADQKPTRCIEMVERSRSGQPSGLTKYLNRDERFVEEPAGEFEMDIELDTLGIFNPNPANLDSKQKFSEPSVDPNVQFDVLEELFADDQFGGLSSDMTMEDLANTNIMRGDTDHKTSLSDAFEPIGVSSNTSAVSLDGGNQCVQNLSALPSWIGSESLPRYDVVSSRVKEEMFLNPNQLDGFKKKKRRPDPIIIPPCVNNFETVTSHHCSPDPRKNSLPPYHPPPPYTALPVNMAAADDFGLFQVPYGCQTPQSAPTFHCNERNFSRDQSNDVIGRKKEIFHWDQGITDSVIETEMRPYPSSSCYGGFVDASLSKELGSWQQRRHHHHQQQQQPRLDSTQGDLGQFNSTCQKDASLPELSLWEHNDGNGYRQNVLEKGKML